MTIDESDEVPGADDGPCFICSTLAAASRSPCLSSYRSALFALSIERRNALWTLGAARPQGCDVALDGGAIVLRYCWCGWRHCGYWRSRNR
jgi:hypothetical protein